VKKLLLPLVFTLFVSCSSLAGFVQSCIDKPVVENVDNSPKGKVTSSLFTAAHVGAVGGFIIAVLAGVASVTVPSKRLAGVSFIAALVGATCLLCVYLMAFIDYIVWGVIAALLSWGLYQLYQRHYEGIESKESKEVIKDLSRRFEDVAGRNKLGDKARIQLAIHEGEEG
jgi:uncharacterized membrane protein YeaQ/YmgE (transglycosylase-associated protein family)